MMNCVPILFFFFTIWLCPLFSVEQQGEKEPSIPNPLELKQDWWQFFDVPDDKIKGNLEEFKKKINGLKVSLNDDSHQEIHKIIDQVYLMLDLLIQKREEVLPSKLSQLQLLKAYTLEELLNVHEKLQLSKIEMEAVRGKIIVMRSRLNRLQMNLDRSIISYQALSPATFEKFKQGMLIIKQRTEYALQRLQLQRDRERLDHAEKTRVLFREELDAAKKRLLLSEDIQESLIQKYKDINTAYSEAKEKLFLLEKQSNLIDQDEGENELACCLGDTEVFSQAITVENLELKLLINNIKQVLAVLAVNHREADFNNIQVRLVEWRRQLEASQEQHNYWERKIKEDQAQVSRMTIQSLQEEGKGLEERDDLIGDIHFELDKSLAELEQLKIYIENGEFLSRLVEEHLVEKKSFLQTWLITFNSYTYKVKELLDYWTHVTLFRIKEQPVSLMTLITAILIFLGTLIFSHYLKKMLIKKRIVERSFSRSTEYIVLRLIHYAIVIIGLVITLSYIGLDFTNFAIVAGALGVGIGFGLQTIVSNISSGFMLLLKKYVKVGDVIELDGNQLGTITAVNLQNSIIRTFDGAEVMIPNAQLSNQRLVNWTMKDNARRFKIPFGVAYGTSKELVRESVIDAVKKLPFVHAGDFRYSDPQVWLMEFGNSSVIFELVAWVDLSVPVPYETSRSALMWELDTTLKNNGIEIPFPQRDVHIKSFPTES